MAQQSPKLTRKEIWKETGDHEYLPLCGLETFLHYGVKVALGEKYAKMDLQKVSAIQCPNDTGGIRLALHFMEQALSLSSVFVPSSHQGASEIANGLHFEEIIPYTGINEIKARFVKAQLKTAAIILDCRIENKVFWKQACKFVKENRVLPLLLVTWVPVRKLGLSPLNAFLDSGLEVIVLQSFQHLLHTNEDAAALLLGITADAHGRLVLQSQMELYARCIWGSPPYHGANAIAKLLQELDNQGPRAAPIQL